MTTWSIGGEGGNAFPFDNIGDYVQGTVLDLAEVQQTDLQTNQPAFWDNGDPKMQYRVTLQTELRDPANPADDGKRTIYLRGAKKPKDDGGKSSLCAVLDAVKAATGSQNLAYGGKLTLQYAANGQPTQRGFNPPKYYQAWYEPPVMALEQPAEHRTPAPAPAAAPQPAFGSPAHQAQVGAPPAWAGAPAAPPVGVPGAQPATLAGQPNPYAAPGAPGADPFPAQAPAGGPIDFNAMAQAQQQLPGMQPPPAAAPAGPPTAPPAAAAPGVAQPTREAIASLQAAGVDPTAVYGPGWEQRLVG